MPDLSSEHFRQVMAHVQTGVVVAGVVEGRRKGLSAGTFVPVSLKRSDIERVAETGDHVLVLGRVLDMGVETGQTPLLHRRSSFLGVSEAADGAAGSEQEERAASTTGLTDPELSTTITGDMTNERFIQVLLLT